MKKTWASLLTAVLGATLLGPPVRAQVLPPAPPSLKTVAVPEPSDLALFVRDTTAAITLGKALFWDMQLGSDGIQACASCHFHAGADSRTKNQLNPGTVHGAATFEVARPNHTLASSDFPFHRFADPANRFSPVLFDSDDVVSSQGVSRMRFADIVPGRAQEMCSSVPDPIWNVGGTNVRRVAPRNAPSVINAIFNFRNLWNGRGNAVFNGVSSFGPRDAAARVLQVQADGSVLPVPVAIDHGSVASVAVGPPVSPDLMSCAGRTWPKIGKKLLSLTPLGGQVVDPHDSVLGTLANSARTPGAPGLQISYATLIQTAFQPQYWNSPKVVTFPLGVLTISGPTGAPLGTDQFTVSEANFSLFFGLAVQLYQATLVSNDSPFDRFMDGGGEGGANTNVLTPEQKLGLAVFTNVGLNPRVGAGGCVICHTGAEFTSAAISRIGFLEPPNPVDPPPVAEGVIEQMPMALAAALRALRFATDPAGFEPGTLPLDFDPRGQLLEIRKGPGVDAPVAFSAIVPGTAGSCAVDLIAIPLAPNPAVGLGVLPFASAFLTVAPDCSMLFEVGVKVAPSGDYPVYVGGVLRGTITVVPDAFYDAGFYNIGVRPTADDVGVGGETPVGVPLAFARRIQLGLATPEITGLPGASFVIGPTDTIAVDGALKAPSLRNVELTAPYFHNGGMTTLDEVLAFYNRGGDFHELNLATLDPVIAVLGLTVAERTAVVAFLHALTDDRVRFEMAPFDHPQLLVPNGHPGDETAVTDNGTGAATDALLELPPAGTVGDCVGIDGTPRICDDHNPCTTDSCQPGVGCVSVANPLACDDGNPCTDDSCDPVRGCAHTTNTRPCSDGSVCTTGDRCRAGVCVGTSISCDDQNTCTDDSCDAVLGCRHTPNTSPCSDGNSCTTGDHCGAGACQGGPPPNCDDGNPCTDEGCSPATGCLHTPVSCNDGDLCTADSCDLAQGCVHSPISCDDRNVCTIDSCEPRTGCAHTPVSCDDGDPCTDDVCDPVTGCSHVPNTASCEDGDPRTILDHCEAGRCVPGPLGCPATPLEGCRVSLVPQ